MTGTEERFCPDPTSGPVGPTSGPVGPTSGPVYSADLEQMRKLALQRSIFELRPIAVVRDGEIFFTTDRMPGVVGAEPARNYVEIVNADQDI